MMSSRARRPVWDNPRGQLPGTGIRREVQLKDPVVPQQVNIDGTGLGAMTWEGSKILTSASVLISTGRPSVVPR